MKHETQSIEEMTFEMLKAQNAYLLEALKEMYSVAKSDINDFTNDELKAHRNMVKAITNAEK